MHNEFTAIIETHAEWFIAHCPKIPGANGQGRIKEEAKTKWNRMRTCAVSF